MNAQSVEVQLAVVHEKFKERERWELKQEIVTKVLEEKLEKAHKRMTVIEKKLIYWSGFGAGGGALIGSVAMKLILG